MQGNVNAVWRQDTAPPPPQDNPRILTDRFKIADQQYRYITPRVFIVDCRRTHVSGSGGTIVEGLSVSLRSLSLDSFKVNWINSYGLELFRLSNFTSQDLTVAAVHLGNGVTSYPIKIYIQTGYGGGYRMTTQSTYGALYTFNSNSDHIDYHTCPNIVWKRYSEIFVGLWGSQSFEASNDGRFEVDLHLYGAPVSIYNRVEYISAYG